MLAYHNDAAVKQFYIDRLTAHYNADEITKGQYWENGKGCAVGCIVHDNDHSTFPEKLGIPIWFARMAIDQVFEKLPNLLSQEWPLRIMRAIPVGGDLDSLFNPLLVWIVKRAKSYVKVDQWGVIHAIDAVIKALETGVGLSEAEVAARKASASASASASREKSEEWNEALQSAAASAAAEVSADAAGAEGTKWAIAWAVPAAAMAAGEIRRDAVWSVKWAAGDVLTSERAEFVEAMAARELFWTDLSDEIIKLLGDTHVSISQ